MIACNYIAEKFLVLHWISMITSALLQHLGDTLCDFFFKLHKFHVKKYLVFLRVVYIVSMCDLDNFDVSDH